MTLSVCSPFVSNASLCSIRFSIKRVLWIFQILNELYACMSTL